MAKLVIGTSGTGGVPAIVQDKSPKHCVEYVATGGVYSPGGTVMNFNGITGIDTYGCGYLYAYTTDKVSPQSVDLSTIGAVGMYGFTYGFINAYWLTGEINLNSLTQVGAGAFQNAFSWTIGSTGSSARITKLKCNSLVTVDNNSFPNMFENNLGLTNGVEFKALTTVNASGAFTAAFKQSGITSADFSRVGIIKGFESAFENAQSLTSIDFGAATDIVPYADVMCHGCTALTSVNLTNLETISGAWAATKMFTGCSALRSIDLDKLRLISGAGVSSNGGGAAYCMFYQCSQLSEVKMKSLKEIMGNATAANRAVCGSMFEGCVALPTFAFQSLDSIAAGSCFRGMFGDCTSLQTLWFYALTQNSFGAYTTQFTNMLGGDTNVTVHFPMAVQSTIGSWSDVTGGFGGTNTTVLFDIVTSLTGADTNTYTRSEKDSASTATAWKYNGVLYYTSGVSNHTAGVHEPTVGATIYSDDACTTAVTTISAIA